MLKINLSDGEGKKQEDQNLEEPVEQEEVYEPEDVDGVSDESDTMADMLGDTETPEASGKSEAPEGKRGKVIKVVALALVFIAIAAVIFTQRSMIMSLVSRKAEVPAPTPPPPAPIAAPEPVRVEPDPTFVTLGRISDVVPDRIWLSSATISSDGRYDITGMSFAYEALGILSSNLGKIGEIGSQEIPAQSKSSETIYQFNIAGSLTGMSSPEILDIIPTDELVAIAAPVIERSGDLGMKFLMVPDPGKTYMDRDLPFMLDGPFTGLKQIVRELCPEGGQIRVHRLVIKPAPGSRTFDRVQASFSLRTTSSI